MTPLRLTCFHIPTQLLSSSSSVADAALGLEDLRELDAEMHRYVRAVPLSIA